VLKIAESDIGPAPGVFSEDDVHYVSGVGKYRDRLIILVDLSKILQKGELRRLGELPAGTRSN
jgi:purine-binding chemotaxis protein CheW